MGLKVQDIRHITRYCPLKNTLYCTIYLIYDLCLPHCSIFQVHGFGKEIDSYRRLKSINNRCTCSSRRSVSGLDPVHLGLTQRDGEYK
jgi:hypothetical protein